MGHRRRDTAVKSDFLCDIVRDIVRDIVCDCVRDIVRTPAILRSFYADMHYDVVLMVRLALTGRLAADGRQR